ncbi:MAG: M48 family metallopeptidase [Spirochaetia bacterium]
MQITPIAILTIYGVFLIIEIVVENLLTYLNIRYNATRKDTVPEKFTGEIGATQYKKSIEYTLSKNKFSIISSIYQGSVILIIVLTGALGTAEEWVSSFHLHPYVEGVLYVLGISFCFSLIQLPFSIYYQFVIEQRFGFNKQTPKLFVTDLIKSFFISGVLTAFLLLCVFWFLDFSGDLWWVFAFCAVACIQLAVTLLYPYIIAPIFNKFTPLEDENLKERVHNLAQSLGFPIAGVYVMDGSKRSSHSNAYFTGMGKLKRIVLFDTLLEKLENPEIIAVLAHEIGHQKLGHIQKRIILSLFLLGTGFFVLQLFIDFSPLFYAFGFTEASVHGLLVILSIAAGPFAFFLTPVISLWSRKHEYEADRFAVRAMEGHEELESALVTIGKDNLSNLTPHPLYSFFHYTHPALNERISAIRKAKG